MVFRKNFDFFKNATAAATSPSVGNANSDTLTLQISGTFSVANLTVKAKTDINADFVPTALINLADYTVIKNGTVTAKGRYAVAIEGARAVQIVLNSISGGNITAHGEFSDTAEG